jgi:carbamoyl-phosphate synthase large subunit
VPESDLTVLVLAVGGNVSQGILKALGKSRLRCRVIGADVSALQAGLYRVDTAYTGPWAHESGFLEWLLDLCRREGVQAVLSGAEPVLQVIAQHRDRIEAESGARCIVSRLDIMERCDDKLRTSEWLEGQDFNQCAWAASEDMEGLHGLRDTSGYPLIAKPRRGGGAAGLLVLRDDADLEYIARREGYLVQECLGGDADEYTAGCFIGRDGECHGSIVMWRALHTGTTYRAVLGAYPEVRAEAERIARALGPMGPCNIQLRMTDRGPVCFEINPRFSGTTPIRAWFGYNEAEAALRHFVLGEKAEPLPRVTEGVALRYWNELYADPAAISRLEEYGRLEAPRHSGRLENFNRENPAG